MGQDFSGSWSVTSRHPLLHSGVPNATRSARFGAEGVAPYRSGALAAELGGTLATTNFREFLLCELRRIPIPRTRVNREEAGGPLEGAPRLASPYGAVLVQMF